MEDGSGEDVVVGWFAPDVGGGWGGDCEGGGERGWRGRGGTVGVVE